MVIFSFMMELLGSQFKVMSTVLIRVLRGPPIQGRKWWSRRYTSSTLHHGVARLEPNALDHARQSMRLKFAARTSDLSEEGPMDAGRPDMASVPAAPVWSDTKGEPMRRMPAWLFAKPPVLAAKKMALTELAAAFQEWIAARGELLPAKLALAGTPTSVAQVAGPDGYRPGVSEEFMAGSNDGWSRASPPGGALTPWVYQGDENPNATLELISDADEDRSATRDDETEAPFATQDPRLLAASPRIKAEQGAMDSMPPPTVLEDPGIPDAARGPVVLNMFPDAGALRQIARLR